MSEQYYSIKSDTLTDIADAIRSKTGKSDKIEVEDYATEIESISGSGGEEINTGTCTIHIIPPSTSNYYICRESVNNAGTVNYNISRQYTGSTMSFLTRCNSIIYIQASTIKGANITDGELLKVASGYGIAYRTPSIKDTIVQITLTG